MTRINTNVSSLTAQQNLAKSNDALQTALTRLSTGLRINSGKDDPAGLIASEMLRGDIVSTNKAISNTERANQMIATADAGLAQISSLLNDIRGLVTEAANTGAMSNDQLAANQLQVDASLNSIDRISNTTAFQGKKLLDGSLGFTYTTAATNIADLDIQQANLGTSGSLAVTVDITTAAAQATLTGTIAGASVAHATVATGSGNLVISTVALGAAQNGIIVHFIQDASVTAGQATAQWDSGLRTLTIKTNTGAAVIAGTLNTAIANAYGGVGLFTTDSGAGFALGAPMPADTTTTGGGDGVLATALNFTLTGSKGSQVFNFGAGMSGTDIATAITNASDSTGVTAAYGAPTLTLTSTDYGYDARIHIGVNSGTSIFTSYDDRGLDIVGKINGVDAAGKGNKLSVNNNTLAMGITVSNGSAVDVTMTITGGGALFQLGPEVITAQQARIGINAMNTGSLGGTDGKLFQIADGQSDDLNTDPTTAAAIVEEAATKVTDLRGRLGALQKTVMETNVDALNSTLNALTDTESLIRDADFAAETANLTRAQILVQSGTAVLQIANKQPQNVLALLQG